MNIPLLVTVGYVLITSAIALTTARRSKGVREFFIAGGQLPWIMLVPFWMAEYVAVSATVGNAELAHKSGIISIWYQVGAPIGLSLLVFGLAKFYKTIRKVTVGEAFGILFGTRTRLAALVILFIANTFSFGASCLALGAIIAPMFNLPYESGVYLTALVMIVVAMAGGLRGIARMNMVHLVTIIICFVTAAIASVRAVGGLGDLFASLPLEHLDLGRPGWPNVAAWVIGSSGVKLVSLVAVTAVFAAKDERSAKIGGVTTGIFVIFFAALPMLIGLSAFVIMPDIPSKLALWKMGEYGGPVISTMVSLGVVAAIFSTMPGFLLSLGALVTRDGFRVIRPEASERSQLIFSRITMVVLGFGGTWLALKQPTILDILFGTAQMRAMLFILLLLAVLWRRIHPTAAFWTIVIGGGTTVIWFLTGKPFDVEPLWPGSAIGILTLIITSLRNRPSPFKGTEGLETTLDADR